MICAMEQCHMPFRLVALMALCVGVLPSTWSPDVFAASGRLVILDGGKHRVMAVDRESRAVINENTDFIRGDCLVQLSPGELIVCDGSQFVHVGLDLRETRRTPTSFAHVSNITALPSDNLLVSDTSRHAIVSIDSSGNELFSMMFHHPVDVRAVTNQRFAVADGTAMLKVFDLNRVIVRQVRLPQWVASLVVARDTGDLLVGESSGYELLDALFRQQWFRPAKSRVTCIQNLPDGEILLCEPDLHRVVIVDRSGVVVWSLSSLEHPWRALYLP